MNWNEITNTVSSLYGKDVSTQLTRYLEKESKVPLLCITEQGFELIWNNEVKIVYSKTRVGATWYLVEGLNVITLTPTIA